MKSLFQGKQNQPPEVPYKKGVHINFAKFTGKHLRQSLFLDEGARLRIFEMLFEISETCNFIKKETLTKCFPVNFAKFLKIAFFTEHLWAIASG